MLSLVVRFQTALILSLSLSILCIDVLYALIVRVLNTDACVSCIMMGYSPARSRASESSSERDQMMISVKFGSFEVLGQIVRIHIFFSFFAKY